MTFCVQLPSHSILVLRLIHVGTCVSTSFLFLWPNTDSPSRVHTTFCLLIHPLGDTWVHLLIVVSCVAMDICVQRLFESPFLVLFGWVPRSRIAGPYGRSIF